MGYMIFSLAEIIDIVITMLALGFIFQDFFSGKREGINVHTAEREYDPLKEALKKSFFDKRAFIAASLIVGLSVVIHEFGHKFVAMFFGFKATFAAHYFGLGLGVVLKLMASPFLIFVPAMVRITGNGGPLELSAVAFAGPLVHLIFWMIAALYLKRFDLNVGKRHDMHKFVYATAFLKINKLLFIFNMLPIPGFDGFQVYRGLFQAFF